MGMEGGAPYERSVHIIRDRYLKVVIPDRPLAWIPNTYALQLSDEMRERERKRKERLKRRMVSAGTEKGEEAGTSRRIKGAESILERLGADEPDITKSSTSKEDKSIEG